MKPTPAPDFPADYRTDAQLGRGLLVGLRNALLGEAALLLLAGLVIGGVLLAARWWLWAALTWGMR